MDLLCKLVDQRPTSKTNLIADAVGCWARWRVKIQFRWLANLLVKSSFNVPICEYLLCRCQNEDGDSRAGAKKLGRLIGLWPRNNVLTKVDSYKCWQITDRLARESLRGTISRKWIFQFDNVAVEEKAK